MSDGPNTSEPKRVNCAPRSEYERRHLAFRDYLRNHPQIANEYVALKRSLAAAHVGATPQSPDRYSLAKTAFVTAVLQLSPPR